MIPTRYSAISHRGLDFCNPLGDRQIEHAIDLLAMLPAERAIDFGAGKGELLIRLVERYGISATAVELADSRISDPGRASKGGQADGFAPDRRTLLEEITVARVPGVSWGTRGEAGNP